METIKMICQISSLTIALFYTANAIGHLIMAVCSILSTREVKGKVGIRNSTLVIASLSWALFWGLSKL